MKRIAKLPTILGVLILIAGVVTGVILINSTQVFKLGANVAAEPKNVRLSNITDNSATVTWTTDIESNGFVKWGKSESGLSKVALEDESKKGFVHTANIIGADPNSNVFFKINSDSTDYDNGGIAWQTKTLATKNSADGNLIASGTILKNDGSTPAKAIVYLTVNGAVLSAITSDAGNFVIPISTYIANVPENSAIEISVQGGSLGVSQAVVYPKSVKFIPAMILGRTYDFRTATQNDSNQLPESTLTIPESVSISSRFEVTKTETATDSSTVKIDSIDEGEIITTTDPEFFGTAPKNTELEVIVESELQTDNLTVGTNGRWTWSPPKNLEPGEHKLTVKWRDSSGILRTLTRTFIVSASEGPAFESTPSGTPRSTATATATSTASSAPSSSSSPSATPVVSKTPTATMPPTPETGSLTPTIALFIMGIGILGASVFVWNKSYAER